MNITIMNDIWRKTSQAAKNSWSIKTFTCETEKDKQFKCTMLYSIN